MLEEVPEHDITEHMFYLMVYSMYTATRVAFGQGCPSECISRHYDKRGFVSINTS